MKEKNNTKEQIMETLRKHKRLSVLFFAVLVSFFAFAVSANGLHYLVTETCPYYYWDDDLVDRISVANAFSDGLNTVSWLLLKGVAYLIDYVEKSIDQILQANVYEGVKEFFDFDSWIYPLASAIFLFCLVGCVIFLMVFYNKGRMSAFLKSVIMASFLIFIFPALISALTDLKDRGVDAMDAIDPSGSTTTVDRTLGEMILSSVTVDMVASAKSIDEGHVTYVSETSDYANNDDFSIYDIDINKTINEDTSPTKWTFFLWKTGSSTDPDTTTYKEYDELTEDNILELFGVLEAMQDVEDSYNTWSNSTTSQGRHQNVNNVMIDGYEEYGVNYGSEGPGSIYISEVWQDICVRVYHTIYDEIGAEEAQEFASTITEDGSTFVGKNTLLNKTYRLTLKETYKEQDENGDFVEVIYNLTENPSAVSLGSLIDIQVSPSASSLKTRLVNLLKDLGVAETMNTKLYEQIMYDASTGQATAVEKAQGEDADEDANVSDYYKQLYLEAEYEYDLENSAWGIDFFTNVGNYITYLGKYWQEIYWYDFDFLFGLIALVSVLVSLIFAAFRLVRLLLDIVFMQIIGPIVFASDLQDSGRTKRLLQELISSFIVIIIVLLMIKLYIMILLWTFRNDDFNILTKLLFVLGDFRFAVDGPDIVVKLCGVDAGVKSGQAAILGAYAAGRTATNTVLGSKGSDGRRHGGVAGTVKNAAGGAAGMLNGAVGAIAGGAAVGAAGKYKLPTGGSSNGSSGGSKSDGGSSGSGSAGGSSGSSSDSSGGVSGSSGSASSAREGNYASPVSSGGSDGANGGTGANGDSGSNGSSGENGFGGESGANGEQAGNYASPISNASDSITSHPTLDKADKIVGKGISNSLKNVVETKRGTVSAYQTSRAAGGGRIKSAMNSAKYLAGRSKTITGVRNIAQTSRQYGVGKIQTGLVMGGFVAGRAVRSGVKTAFNVTSGVAHLGVAGTKAATHKISNASAKGIVTTPGKSDVMPIQANLRMGGTQTAKSGGSAALSNNAREAMKQQFSGNQNLSSSVMHTSTKALNSPKPTTTKRSDV